MSLVRTTVDVCPHDGAPASLVRSLPEGTKIGDYTIVRMLGEGGMGAVYEVWREDLSRRAAMKFLLPELVRHKPIVSRFLQEARAANLVNHDNIINITDYGEDFEGVVYLVMEFLEGEALSDFLAREARLSTEQVIHIFSQIMRALSAAHKKQIVHRDLKPDNVFLIEREDDPKFVKLLDFGVAALRGEGSIEGLTREGALLGTPQYMSPEQARGAPADARSDVFAIGVMMYEAVTGKLPFDAEVLAATLSMVIMEEPEPPRQAAPDADIPVALEAMIQRAMRKEPDERYQTIDEMLADFATVKAEAGIPDRDATVANGAAPTEVRAMAPRAPARRGRTLMFAGVAVVVAAALGMVFAMTRSGGDSQQASASKPAAAHDSDPGKPTIKRVAASGDMAGAKNLAKTELLTHLKDGETIVKGEVIEALRRAGTSRAAPVLYAALAGSPQVRVEAARTLRELKLPDAAPKIRKAIQESGNRLRVPLTASLVALGDKDGVALLEQALTEPRDQLDAALALAEAKQGDKALPTLKQVFERKTRNRASWLKAARGLLALGDPDAKAALTGELARPEPERAVAAAEILARAGDQPAIDYLDRVIDDPEFSRRGAAALALARAGQKSALRFVESGLTSEDGSERAFAVAVAGRLARQGGDQYGARLAGLATDDPDRRVRLTAMVSLLAM